MTEPNPIQRLTPEMRDLLAAIHEALDLPLPGFTEADQRARSNTLNARAAAVTVAAGAALTMAADAGVVHVPTLTESIRQRVATSPVTYTTWPPAAPTCGRCHQPFDPTDTRFDGHAQHKDTPFCRRCIDRCHESTDAFHRCPVCDPITPNGGEQQ